ncbi:hypothetical protein CFC21_043211 [Triticum aestivum]|uniref:Uncharacterized protein n=3 Tax=Triticum TaxID=4564 RepID=A0A9R1QSX1_TRITD|nr:uncharacterized protein LOC119277864 [Triticum dicoccoides]XP_044351223.1 uncharacterized protein LOC123071702 [Triticum aestivum]KAF7031973.1 hypothetical protein CFC21_043211 [Triticum aestivum]VAH82738.1 unnamed protein product [Triticum turgidum subsp. durum]
MQAPRAPVLVQNENLPIFRGVDGKKAGVARGHAARAGRRALGDLGRAGKAPPAGASRKAAAAAAAVSVQGSKGVAKPSSLSDGDWVKCCEWAKGGIETASFTGNDMQRLMADEREERIRKKVEKAMSTLQVSMDSIYDIDEPSKISMDDPDDETTLELDPEILPPMSHLSSRLGEHDGNYLLPDLEFEYEAFSGCNFELKLKDGYGNDSSSKSTILLR